MERWERLLDELGAEIQLREDELQLLHTIDLQLLESERPLKSTFDFIVARTRRLLRSDHAAILLRRGQFLEPSYVTTSSDLHQKVDIAGSLTGKCLTSDRTLNIADIDVPGDRELYVPLHGYTGKPMRSLLATPIKVGETAVGVLSVESTRPGAFHPVHEEVMTAVAAQVAIALQRARLFDQNALFSSVEQLVFAEVESPRLIQAAMAKVLDALRELEHLQITDALICFRKGRDLQVVHSTLPSEVGLVLGIDESICGRAVRERRTVILGNVHEEPDYRRLLGDAMQSEIAVPIILGQDNDVIGVLNIESEEKDAFQGFAQIIVESFAERVGVLLAFAKLRADVTDTMEMRNATDLIVAVGDQASNMIHRINNTVGAMRLRIIELQEQQQTGEIEPDSFLAESLGALRNLADMTLQMPDDVTQVLSQQSSMVDVNDAVKQALARVRVPEKVTVDLGLGPDLPLLSLYCFDIVIQNLIQNAIDAMPDGGVMSVMTESAVQPDLPSGYIQVTVTDTGSGIPDGILPKIFELNFSTKGAKGKGLGLGLWWIRNFVRRANGNIAITSREGEGAQVVVRFPVDRSDSARDPGVQVSDFLT